MSIFGGGSDRPKTRHGKEWYSEYAICPMCGDFTRPVYHKPGLPKCVAPTSDTHHNHLWCRCGYEWTLPPRNPPV